jgi:hypothetical protein
MAETMTIADALSELKRIKKLIPKKYQHLRVYSSKRRGGKDLIDSQAKFVKSETKAALDLITRFKTIKRAINTSNLQTYITLDKESMTVGDAILYKQQYKEMYDMLWDSFTPDTGNQQIAQYSRTIGVSPGGLSEEQLAALDLVPQLLYNAKNVIKQQEHHMKMYAEADKLIEKSNHVTTITI